MVVVQGKVFDLVGINELFIEEMNKIYLPMKINGVEDKAGYKAVHEGIQQYVKARATVEKHAKEVRAKALQFQREVISEEKRVIGLMAPGEEHLRAERKAVDDIQAALKAEEERMLAEKIQSRVDRICAFGATFNGTLFSAYGIQVAHKALEACSDEGFEQFVAQVEKAKAIEDARLREEEAARKAEAERLRKNEEAQEAERKRLERIAQEQAEKQAAIEAEEKRLAGEKQRLIDEERARLKAIEDEKVRAESEKLRREELEKAKKEAAEKAVRDAEEKAKKEAEAKAKKEAAAKLAAERKAARQPDKVKLQAYVAALAAVAQPELKTDEGQGILGLLVEEIGLACSHADSRIEEL